MFRCKCGAEFASNRSLGGHKTKCKIFRSYLKDLSDDSVGEEIEQRYIDSAESIQMIAQQFQLDMSSVRVILNLRGIILRDIKESCGGARSQRIRESMIKRYGVTNPSQLDWVKLKKAQTTIEHYGVENPYQSEVVKDKIKDLCLSKYGTAKACQSEVVKDKIKKTNLTQYGVENPYQSEVVKDKIKHIKFEKYGAENLMSLDWVKEKIHQTKLEKYGDNYMDIVSAGQRKSMTTIHAKLCELLRRLGVKFEVEQRVGKYKVDILLLDFPICIEAYGDYWHANPQVYLPDDFNSKIGMTSKDKWEFDDLRKAYIENTGIKVLVFWEYDINENWETVETNIRDAIYEDTKNYKVINE